MTVVVECNMKQSISAEQGINWYKNESLVND